MDWIKRNLLFVIGSAVALILMGLAGYLNYSGLNKNQEALDKLNAEYETLKQLNAQNPHPGDEKTDNIKAARDQEKAVRVFIGKSAEVFRPIPPIPADTNLDNAMLASALRRTLDQMRKDATSRGVQIATNYYFSFTAEKDRIMFDKAGVLPLAAQLGEVKVICDVLFAARVNAIDNIRRTKVSVHDFEAQLSSDYVDRGSTTNEIAIISPYEISLRCFSSEIAGILSGFASSPHGLIVRAINVEPAVLGGTTEFGQPAVSPIYVAPPPVAAPNFRRIPGEEEGIARPVAPPPTVFTPTPTPTPGRGGLPILLDEKQLKVTVLIDVVKLISK